jgi:hypothetical protein
MSDLADRRPLSKLHAVETRAARIYPNLHLPAHLRSLPAHAREAIGKAIDAGIARLLLDHRGEIVVAWSARA